MGGQEGFERVVIHRAEGTCLLNLGWSGVLSSSLHGSGVVRRVRHVHGMLILFRKYASERAEACLERKRKVEC